MTIRTGWDPQHLETLRTLGFPPLVDVVDRNTIARLLRKSQRRSGIYVLALEGGMFYIGLARDVVRRFGAHRRKFGSRLIAFAFRPTLICEMESFEREAIKYAEQSRLPLEQTEWKSEVFGATDLDSILTESEFTAWRSTPEPSYTKDVWKAPQFEDGRVSRDNQRLAALSARKDCDDIVALLSTFARLCIPAARSTAHDFWSISSLPSTNSSTSPRLVCVSAHVMEVFVLGYDKGASDSVWGFIVAAASPLVTEFGTLRAAAKRLRVDDIEVSNYKSAGHDQCIVSFSGLSTARRLIVHDVVRDAVGLLLYRVMRKGTTRYANVHCTTLANAILT